MDELDGVKLGAIPVAGLEWECDLYGLDGPLLSQFTSDSGKRYLYSWCDCDGRTNRWMVFPVKEADRVRLIIGKKTLRDVVEQAKQDFVFFLDIRNESNSSTCYLVEGACVPEAYIPEQDSFIEVDSPLEVLDKGQVSLLFESSWEIETIRDFVRCYQQAYDFTLGLSRNLIGSVTNLPWQGGFSAMHFFDKLKGKVDAGDRMTTDMMQFSSPGIVKLNVTSDVAHDLLKTIFHYHENKTTIDKAFRELSSNITDNKLNQIEPRQAFEQFGNDPNLVGLYEDFIAVLGFEDKVKLVSLNRSSFETTKIFFAHYKRVKTIHSDLTSGQVSMARWELVMQANNNRRLE